MMERGAVARDIINSVAYPPWLDNMYYDEWLKLVASRIVTLDVVNIVTQRAMRVGLWE